MEESRMYLPLLRKSLGVDSFEEREDEEHLSKSNWVVVDGVTGIVVYSHLSYLLRGCSTCSK